MELMKCRWCFSSVIVGIGILRNDYLYSFIYGGWAAGDKGANLTPQENATNTALDEVFVLSLPGFVWFKANYTAANPRNGHRCHVVGNRQMLVVGGVDSRFYNDSLQYNHTRPDTFSQGLGVFDMTEMQWSDQYDANAESYVTPQVSVSSSNSPLESATALDTGLLMLYLLKL